jgi:uncharacterized protein (DUF736 family)
LRAMRAGVKMPELVTLGPWLRRFLVEHIVTERNLARNTRTSYRDTFSLLLPFVSRRLRKPVDRLAVRDLTSGLVLQFLAHLEEDRDCSTRTRNQRLAVEIGAAWQRTSKDNTVYHSVKLDDPSFPAPIYANLVAVDDGYALVWSR